MENAPESWSGATSYDPSYKDDDSKIEALARDVTLALDSFSKV